MNRLTASKIDAIKPPEQGQIELYDHDLPGFAFRVGRSGKRAWVLRYRVKANGTHPACMRRLTLGSYPAMSLADARRHARAKLGEVASGGDPAGESEAAAEAEARDRANTLAELAGRYMSHCEAQGRNKARTLAQKHRMLKRLLAVWGTRPASSISRRDIIALVEKIAERGAGIQANRTVALISNLFAFATDREIITANPAHRIPKPGVERSRDRVLVEDEIRRVWKALDDEPRKVAAIVQLTLLTAQRRGEVCGLRWDELDLDRGWWTLPAERAKNKLSHRVPLGPQALAILRAIHEAPHDPVWVFRGGHLNQPLTNLQKPLRRVRTAAKVDDFKLHDLRRTAASLMASLGVPRFVLGRVLNHIDSSITAVYDRHTYDAEKRQALEKLDRHLQAIVNRQPSAEPRVVNLDAYRGGTVSAANA
jgi:integrase